MPMLASPVVLAQLVPSRNERARTSMNCSCSQELYHLTLVLLRLQDLYITHPTLQLPYLLRQ